MVQEHRTCYDSSPHAFSGVRDHLRLVKPYAAAAASAAAAAAALFYKLRGLLVARLVAADVDCSVPPMHESAAGAGYESFLPAFAPRRLPEHAIARDT